MEGIIKDANPAAQDESNYIGTILMEYESITYRTAYKRFEKNQKLIYYTITKDTLIFEQQGINKIKEVLSKPVKLIHDDSFAISQGPAEYLDKGFIAY